MFEISAFTADVGYNINMRRKPVALLMAICVLCGCLCLCGCTRQDDALEPVPLPPMAELRIMCGEEPGEDYIDAKVTASWSEAEAEAEAIPEAFDGAAEIKLRGNSSKEAVKKAYTIRFDGERPFLGMDAGSKWALVSNPFDKSLLRPALGFAYAAAMGMEGTSDFRLCQVWLNDKYMGVYAAMEPVESGSGRVEIDPADGDFLLERNLNREEDGKAYIVSSQGLRFEINEPEAPDEEAYGRCQELLSRAEAAIASGDHREYRKFIDVDSFVDFYIFHEMMKDIDFGEFSTRYHFKDGIMHAGPPWDLDLTMGNASIEKDEEKYWGYNISILEDGMEEADFYGSAEGLWAYGQDYYPWLCQDPWFMKKVCRRWEQLRALTENLAEDNELGTNLIDRYLSVYGEELAEDFGMYKGQLHMSEWQQPAETHEGNVEMLRKWLLRRMEYLDEEFATMM